MLDLSTSAWTEYKQQSRCIICIILNRNTNYIIGFMISILIQDKPLLCLTHFMYPACDALSCTQAGCGL